MLFLKQWNYPWITFPAHAVQMNQSHMTAIMEQQWELRTLWLCLCCWLKKSFTFRIKSDVKSPFSLLFCHQCQLTTIKQLDLNVCLQLHVCDRDIMMVTAARWWAERDRLACLLFVCRCALGGEDDNDSWLKAQHKCSSCISSCRRIHHDVQRDSAIRSDWAALA